MLKCVVRLRLCGHRRQSVPNDDIIQRGCIEVVVISAVTLSQQQRLLRCWLICVGAVSVSDAIDFRLETVIIPSGCLFRSSSLRRVYVDYYFFFGVC